MNCWPLWLGLYNCSVTSAPTMARGVQLAQQETFDLYLIDSRLPDGTGVEVCNRIRAFDSHTPILFWSGDDDGDITPLWLECRPSLRNRLIPILS